MPLDFTRHFVTVPTEFKLRNNTVKLINDRVILDKVGPPTKPFIRSR